MIDLSTQYLGLKLRNPLVVAASPLCKEISNLRHMEDSGAAAIVLHSLFEEQINLESNELDRFLWDGAEVSAESTTIFPDLQNYNIGPDGYLEHIRHGQAELSPFRSSPRSTASPAEAGSATPAICSRPAPMPSS